MAKGNLFLSQGRGKVGSVVFSVNKGQQISRVYNPKPANPRSNNQQAQRSLLANMTKFYKRAVENYFKLSFETKKKTESDFNAFARENINAGAFITKENYENNLWPALGDWTISNGSLEPNFDYEINGEDFILRCDNTTKWATIGDVSADLMRTYPNVQSGDIITFVLVTSSLEPDEMTPVNAPVWKNRQFRVDTTSTQPITELGFTNKHGGIDYEIGISGASMGAAVLSRQTESGLKVSKTQPAYNAMWGAIYEILRGAKAIEDAAISWGGSAEALLQGANITPDYKNVSEIRTNNEETKLFAFNNLTMSGVKGEAALMFPIAIKGTGLRTQGEGALLSITFYDVSITDKSIYNPKATITAKVSTATSTLIEANVFPQGDPEGTIPALTWRQGQMYYVVSYLGTPISWGIVDTDVQE